MFLAIEFLKEFWRRSDGVVWCEFADMLNLSSVRSLEGHVFLFRAFACDGLVVCYLHLVVDYYAISCICCFTCSSSFFFLLYLPTRYTLFDIHTYTHTVTQRAAEGREVERPTYTVTASYCRLNRWLTPLFVALSHAI